MTQIIRRAAGPAVDWKAKYTALRDEYDRLREAHHEAQGKMPDVPHPSKAQRRAIYLEDQLAETKERLHTVIVALLDITQGDFGAATRALAALPAGQVEFVRRKRAAR